MGPYFRYVILVIESYFVLLSQQHKFQQIPLGVDGPIIVDAPRWLGLSFGSFYLNLGPLQGPLGGSIESCFWNFSPQICPYRC